MNNHLVNRTEFREAIFEFFDRHRGGHLDKYAYLIPTNWERLVTAAQEERSSYYLAHPDIEVPVLERIARKEALIRETGAAITQIFEIGPGTGQKIIPFIKEIETLRSAALIDYEMEFNENAHDAIRAINSDLPLTLVRQDFEAPRLRTRISGNSLGLILGGTICNMNGMPEEYTEFPLYKLTQRFNNVANFYHGGGSLIVTIDSGSEERMMEAYSDKFNQGFVMGALDLIPKILNTDLTKEVIREHFQHNPHYYKHCGMLAHEALCKKDVSFTVEGRQFNIPANWVNSVINSFKPREAEVIQAAGDAGFVHSETFQDDSELIKILKFNLAKKPPGRMHAHSLEFR
jgi:hypothetical protein